MSEYTRTYTYTGQSGWVAGKCTLPLSSFTADENANKIAAIKAISVVYYRRQVTSSNVGHTAQLVFANGAATLTSNKVTKRGDGETFKITNVFSTMPSAADFSADNVSLVTTPDTKISDVQWTATSSRPIQVIVTYEAEPDVEGSTISSLTGTIYIDGKAALTATLNKPSPSAWHRATWKLGSYSNAVVTSGATVSYVVPLDWLYAIPSDATQANGTLTVETYTGSDMATLVGTDTKQFKAAISRTMGAPAFRSGWAVLSAYNTGTAAAGFSTYIQGYSRAKATVDEAKIVTKYGATIADIRILVQGKALPSPYISDALKESGLIEIEGYVTDSRGFTTRETVGSITVLPYYAPSLNNVVLLRSLNNGAPVDGVNGDISGAYLYAKATASAASSVGLQSLVLMYKQRGTDTYSTASLSSGVGKAVSISTERAYDATIVATDNLGNTASMSVIIPHETKTFRLKPGGKAAGIGAAPGADDTLTLGWKLILEEGLESHVPLTPVGGCVILTSGIDPADEFGGSWEQVTWSGAPSGVKLWKRTA